MKSNSKRTLIIIILLSSAILLGFAADLIWNALEKSLHPTDFKEYVSIYAEEYDVPEYLAFAVIDTESSFDPLAKSRAGALGLMQMMPSTFEWLTGPEHLDEGLSVDALFEPKVAIKYGIYYLKYLFDKFDGNWNTALAAYNAGEGNVAAWLKSEEYSDGNGNLTSIPFKETARYVEKVNDNIKTYKNLYYKNKGVTDNE